jgi:hypothetical protein
MKFDDLEFFNDTVSISMASNGQSLHKKTNDSSKQF